MKSKPLADVKARLSEYVNGAQAEPVLITKNGKPAALLVHVDENVDLEDVVIGSSPAFRAILRRGEEQIRRGEVLDEEEFWRQVDERHGAAVPRKRLGTRKPRARRKD